MKAHHQRRQVTNGPVARRASTGVRATAAPRREPARESRRGTAAAKRGAQGAPKVEHGSRVFWIMVVIGGLLTTGFVLGVHSQINTYQINQAEERLRNQLDRFATQQTYLNIQHQQALSPSETAQAGKDAGLTQLALRRASALPGPGAVATPARPANQADAGDESDSARASQRARVAPKVSQAAYVAPAKPPVRKNVVKLAPKAAAKAAKPQANKAHKETRPRQVVRASARR